MADSTASRSTRAIFLFAFLGWTFDFYDLVLLGFIKDDVARSFALSPSAEAWMLGVALGASGVGGLIAGLFADRFGKRDVLASTVLLYSIGSLVAGVAPSLPIFILGRAIVGLGVGGEWAIGHAMVAEAVRARVRGRASAALQAGEPVGVAIAAIVAFTILPRVGWRWVMIGSAATAILALIMRRSLHLPNEPASARAPLRILFKPKVRRRVGMALLLGIFKLGTYWSCYTWLPGFLKKMDVPVGRSLAWILTAQVGQFLGMMSFGAASDRFGRRPAFCAYSLLTACAIAPIAFAWHTLLDHRLWFWTAMFFLGVGSGCTAGFGALLAELFPNEARSTAMGTTYNLARAAQLATPVLVGAFVAFDGIRGGLCVPLVLAVATASWVWVLPETRGVELGALQEENDA